MIMLKEYFSLAKMKLSTFHLERETLPAFRSWWWNW